MKGAVIEGFRANVWRRDMCGHAMKYVEHGVEGKFGWEIDHIKPVAGGGGDELSNLQPLWWENNRRKGDNYPWSG
jgi:5-methylcytosine-specific restriction endonuclease McrA